MEWKCQEEGCEGYVINNIKNAVPLKTGCRESTINAFPCSKCGRLYFEEETPVNKRSGEKAFFINGKLIHRN